MFCLGFEVLFFSFVVRLIGGGVIRLDIGVGVCIGSGLEWIVCVNIGGVFLLDGVCVLMEVFVDYVIIFDNNVR